MTSILQRGIDLAQFAQRLGRTPSADELRVEFDVDRATAFRYRRVLRGKPPTGRRITRQRVRRAPTVPPRDISDAEAKLMAEFGFTREKAAEVLAYERGEGMPA